MIIVSVKSGRAFLLAALCAVGGQAHAGLFDDDEARFQIRQIEDRISAQERMGNQQTEANKQLAEALKQQTRSMLDLQAQIEAQSAELRGLRGQNEELAHKLRDAEKRQKDFYIDLDTRLRHFESMAAAPPLPVPSAPQPDKTAVPDVTDDLVAENRAYEAAYGLLKAGKHQNAVTAFQDFVKRFPDSVHVPNAHFGMGNAHYALKDFKAATASYQVVASKYAFSPKAADAMLGVADCQVELKDLDAADKTLKQLISKYPNSEAANGAKRRLAATR